MAPTGGPKDEKPPILKKRSIADSSLNFKGGKIQFEFDEFLQLKDVSNQLVITPLLKTNPKVTIHKKKLQIDLPDTLLLPNTTYRISFGNAVQDLREGNIVKNLLFTFSTGAYFDSLSLNGKIIEAETGKPDTASWIVLYAMPLSDSAFYKQKPLYAQKSNRGDFRFENLPNKEFKIFSLKESNNNLRYDAAGERIAFYPSKINPANQELFVTLYSFIEKEIPDTATKKLKGKAVTIEPKKGGPLNYVLNVDTMQKNKRTFNINDSIVITFQDSLAKIDKSKIRLFQGDQFDASTSIFIDTSAKKIIIKVDWVQDATYTLNLLKSFAENKQQVISSAGVFNFRTKKESDYGSLSVSLAQNEIQWINLFKDEKPIGQKRATDTLIKFSLLEPGNYHITILEDNNKNGVWDAGSLRENVQPEIVTLIAEPITIKANWGNKINLQATETKPKSRGKK